MKPDLRQLVKAAQSKDRQPDDPDRTIEEVAASCNVNRAHLFSLMSGQPDPSLVKEWTIHRLSRGLEAEPHDVREAINLSRERAGKPVRSSLID